MSHLGDLIRSKREAAGLRPVDVARATGFRNLNKQIRVLTNIESGRDRIPRDVYVERFSRILGIDQAEIVQASSLDYAELARPYKKPHLTVRAVPGFYLQQELPAGCSFEQACEIARSIVQERHMEVALVISRVKAFYFKRDGRLLEGQAAPAMRVGSYGKDYLRLAAQAARVPKEPGA